jgi:hypothetical protein
MTEQAETISYTGYEMWNFLNTFEFHFEKKTSKEETVCEIWALMEG